MDLKVREFIKNDFVRKEMAQELGYFNSLQMDERSQMSLNSDESTFDDILSSHKRALDKCTVKMPLALFSQSSEEA